MILSTLNLWQPSSQMKAIALMFLDKLVIIKILTKLRSNKSNTKMKTLLIKAILHKKILAKAKLEALQKINTLSQQKMSTLR